MRRIMVAVLTLPSVALAAAAGEPELRPTDPEAALDVATAPQPCAQRYRLIAEPQPTAEEPPVTAVRDAFATDRFWGLRENVTVTTGGAGVDRVMEVRFPAGSINPANAEAPLGGAGFYSPIGHAGTLSAACLAYRVRFPIGFAFAKGGKLPGLYGGGGASGGEDAGGDAGFSVRFMWREDGQGELYEYVVNTDATFGLSVARGAWSFTPGRWTELQLEVVLNTPGAADGVARAWVDGDPVVDQSDVAYRVQPDVDVAGLMFTTFFGGSDPSWASPKTQSIQFAAFRLYAPGAAAEPGAEPTAGRPDHAFSGDLK